MTYAVVIEGKVLAGFDAARVRVRFARLIGHTEAVASALLAGHPRTVKSSLDEGTALRYLEALSQIGVACRLEPPPLRSLIAPSTTNPGRTPPARSDHAERRICSACGGDVSANAGLCDKCAGRLRTMAEDARRHQQPVVVDKPFQSRSPGSVEEASAMRRRLNPFAVGLVAAVVFTFALFAQDRLAADPPKTNRSKHQEEPAAAPLRPVIPLSGFGASSLGHVVTRSGTIEITGRQASNPERVLMVFSPSIPIDDDVAVYIPDLVERVYGVRPAPTLREGHAGIRILGDAPRQFMLFEATEGDRIVGIAITPS